MHYSLIVIGKCDDGCRLTMTGVQKTQKMSYTNNPHSRIMPVVVDPKERCSIPSRENARPRVLLANGDLLM